MCSATTDVRFGPKADIRSAIPYVRFTPESRHSQCKKKYPLRPAQSTQGNSEMSFIYSSNGQTRQVRVRTLPSEPSASANFATLSPFGVSTKTTRSLSPDVRYRALTSTPNFFARSLAACARYHRRRCKRSLRVQAERLSYCDTRRARDDGYHRRSSHAGRDRCPTCSASQVHAGLYGQVPY